MYKTELGGYTLAVAEANDGMDKWIQVLFIKI